MNMLKHYERVICACCFLTIFVNMGLAVSTFNVYQPYLIKLIGDMSASMVVSVRTCMALLCILFVSRYYSLLDCRAGMFISGLLAAAGFAVYTFAHSTLLFMCGALLCGMSYGLGTMVAVTILMNRWFENHVGVAIGIAAAGSGLASIFVPVLATEIIENLSLEASFACEALFSLTVSAAVFALIRNRPSDLGLEPYRSMDGKNACAEHAPYPHRVFHGHFGHGASTFNTSKSVHSLGATKALDARSRKLLYAAMLLLGLAATGSSFYFSVLITEAGFNVYTAAAALSLSGASLTIAKMLNGEVFDTLGGKRTTLIFFAILNSGLLLCCLASLRIEFLLFAGAALFGAGISLGTVGTSLWSLDLSTPETRMSLIKNLQIGYTLGGLISTMVMGFVGQYLGSYEFAYAFMLMLGVASMMLMWRVYARHELPAQGKLMRASFGFTPHKKRRAVAHK